MIPRKPKFIDNTNNIIDIELVTNPRWIDLDVKRDEDIELDLKDYIRVQGNNINKRLNADEVFFTEDLVCAGNWEKIGNIQKDIDETIVFETKNKSLKDVMTTIFTKEEQPIKINPSFEIIFPQAKLYEVGSSVSPAFQLSFNEGSYTYDISTGVTFSNYNITDTNGNSSTSQNDSFDSFVVLDDTNYYITATVEYSDGIVAKTNLNNNSNPIVQIKSNSITKNSNNITGYRPFFYGVLFSGDSVDSITIRSKLVNGGNYNSSKTLNIDLSKIADATNVEKIIVLIPKTNTRGGIKNVMKTDGLPLNITELYHKQSTFIEIDDLRETENNMVEYTWWCYQPAKIDPKEVHSIELY